MPSAVSELLLDGNSASRPAVFNQLTGRFVLLCVAKYYAHKNLEILADLFVQHGDELGDVVALVTVEAKQHPRAGRFLARLNDARLRNHVINVGSIDPSELPGYYSHCDGLIFPTLLETFGLPYLEAMQFRRPILTSDLDFAHDVCGSAAIYFDPVNPASIRDAILALKASPQTRDDLVAAGTKRMHSFFRNWDTIVADAVMELQGLVLDDRQPESKDMMPSASGSFKG